jgi:glutamate dehydrogenase
MSVEGLLGTEEERAARQLIEQAGGILDTLDPHIPKTFLSQLFARAAADDLLGYEPRTLAQLGQQAWAFLGTRRPGAPKIRFDILQGVEQGGRPKPLSVIEIVTDDMPFLLDSVMGELTERGLEIRLVVHPVLVVKRDEAGNLVAFGSDSAAKSGGLRESFIQIHVEHVADNIRRSEIVEAIEQVVAQVRVSVQDWRPMLERVAAVIADRGRGDRGGDPVFAMADRGQLHLHWVAGLRLCGKRLRL